MLLRERPLKNKVESQCIFFYLIIFHSQWRHLNIVLRIHVSCVRAEWRTGGSGNCWSRIPFTRLLHSPQQSPRRVRTELLPVPVAHVTGHPSQLPGLWSVFGQVPGLNPATSHNTCFCCCWSFCWNENKTTLCCRTLVKRTPWRNFRKIWTKRKSFLCVYRASVRLST